MRLPHWQAGFFLTTEPLGKPLTHNKYSLLSRPKEEKKDTLLIVNSVLQGLVFSLRQQQLFRVYVTIGQLRYINYLVSNIIHITHYASIKSKLG